MLLSYFLLFHRLLTPFVIVIAVISGISVVAVGLGVGIGVGLKQSSTSSSLSFSSTPSSSTPSSLTSLPSNGTTNANATGNDMGTATNSSNAGRMIGACGDLSKINSTEFEISVCYFDKLFLLNKFLHG